MQQTNKKTIIFARVSSREQEETGYSLPAQEKLMKEYASKKGLRVIKIFSISESASGKKQRAVFGEMIKYVKKQNAKNIICEKVDRLTRNFKDAVLIDEWLEADQEPNLHLVKDSLIMHKNSRSQEKLNWGIRIIFAKNYTDNLSEEVKKGQKEKLAQGWLPNKAPFGYIAIGEKGRKTHVIDKPVAIFIKKTFELYATGNYSFISLVEVMHKKGFRSKNGKKIVKSVMSRMLSRPFYYGQIEFNGEVYPGKQEPIITKELFDKVQRILSGKYTPKSKVHNFMFKALIKCSECGGTIAWDTKKGHIYGYCNRYKPCLQKVRSKEEEIEEQLLKALDNLKIKNQRIADWMKKALKDSHKDEKHYRKVSLEELTKRYDKLQARLDKMYEDKLDEKITEEFYNRKAKEYEKEQAEINEERQKHQASDISYRELGLSFYELSQRNKEIYLKLREKPEEKRKLLKLVFQDFKLNNGILNYTYTKPFEILAKIAKSSKVPKIPQFPITTFELAEKPMDKGKNSPFEAVCSAMRRERDSNPRRTFILTSLAGTRFQPLSHLSLLYYIFIVCILFLQYNKNISN